MRQEVKDYLFKQYGQKIRLARQQKGLTQKQLAVQVPNLSASRLSLFENGAGHLTDQEIDLLLKVLELSRYRFIYRS